MHFKSIVALKRDVSFGFLGSSQTNFQNCKERLSALKKIRFFAVMIKPWYSILAFCKALICRFYNQRMGLGI